MTMDPMGMLLKKNPLSGKNNVLSRTPDLSGSGHGGYHYWHRVLDGARQLPEIRYPP